MNQPQQTNQQQPTPIPQKPTRTSRKELEVMVGDCKSLKNSLLEVLDEISQKKEAADSSLNAINSIKKEIEGYENTLLKGDNETYSIKETIEEANTTISDIYNRAKKLEKDLFGGTFEKNTEIDPTIAATLSQSEIIEIDGKVYQKGQETIQGLKQKIEKIKISFIETHDKLQQEMETIIKGHKESLNNILKEGSKDISALKDQIEKLMPTAMSAGLSSAYEKSTATLSISQRNWALLNIIALILVCIGGMIYFKLFYIPGETVTNFFLNILRLITIEGPLIWIAYFSNKRLKETAKLFEEYRHKWAVAYSYEGLKREAKYIDDTYENSALSPEILEKVLAAYEKNPSDIVDTSAHFPIEKLAIKVADEVSKKIPSLSENTDQK